MCATSACSLPVVTLGVERVQCESVAVSSAVVQAELPTMLRRIALTTCLLLVCGCSSSRRSTATSDASNENGNATGGAAAIDRDSAMGAAGADAAASGGTTGMNVGADGSSTLPSSCPASDEGNVALGEDTFVPNTGLEAVTAITYANVGATGVYAKVTHNWEAPECDGTCETREYEASGPLAPFNEDQTMVFAGPVELYQIGVYQPDASAWQRVAYWDRCTTEGLAVVGNKWWHPCGGFFQSYVSADATEASDTPVQFAGSLAAGEQMNIVSDIPCEGTTDFSDCGWTQGLALRGFIGDARGSKIFATKFRMPFGTTTPAYWILPGQVVRTSQYGCNCRGQGSDPVYRGGCGEIDVAEILGGVTDSREATTTLYSFQDITGGGSVCFNRPVAETSIFLVIFDADTRQIAIRQLGATDFAFGATVSMATVHAWLAEASMVRTLN